MAMEHKGRKLGLLRVKVRVSARLGTTSMSTRVDM